MAALCFTGWLFSGKYGLGPENPDDDRINQPIDPISGAVTAIQPGDDDPEVADSGELEEQLRLTKARLEESEKELNELKADQSEDATAAALSADATLAAMKQDAIALKSVTAVNQTIESELAAAREEIRELKVRVSQLSGVKTDLDASRIDNELLTKKLTTAREASESLKGKMNAAAVESGKLKDRITNLEVKLNELGQEKIELTKNMAAKSGNTGKLKADFEALKKKAEADAEALADAKKQLAEGGGPAMTKLQTEFGALKKRADADAKALAEARKNMGAGANAAVKKLKADFDALKKRSEDDAKALAEARKNMVAGGPDAMKRLRTRLEAAEKKAADEAKKAADTAEQLTALKQQMAAAPAGGNNNGGAAGLPKLDLPNLVNDSNQLSAEGKVLFDKLKSAADTPGSRERLYKEITNSGDAEPALRIPFRSGSDFISAAEKARIKNLLEESGDGAKFLIVGYASTDGSNETNYRLSSQRASNVGKQIAGELGNSDQIEGIYFGQTTRFSTGRLSPNRVVEVWRLK
ncbi:MAG: OmpA family protein [Verrucomicrobiales bacterium]|nr:OmpA family protein [Verrucomicrobiales bacterium]